MTNMLLNIITLGARPLYQKQWKFHKIITDFRNRLARLEEVSLTENDIEAFYAKLNTFDFRFVFFSEYYRKYIANLNRFKPVSINGNIDLTFLIIAIAEDKWKPTEPSSLFLYHLKYKNKLTSRFFISHQKKQNHKKLNNSEPIIAQKSKFDPSKKWTRVPIGKKQCSSSCGCSK